MKVGIFCEESGRVRDEFRKRGHDAWSIDIIPCRPSEFDQYHIQDDVLNHLVGWDLIIAFPPCTRLCGSGVRWLHKPPTGKTLDEMWSDLEQGCALYNAIWNAPCDRICIENPVMHKYAMERIPGSDRRQYIQLHDFGHLETKKTGLQLKGLPPLMPSTNWQQATMEMEYKDRAIVHYLPPSEMRARLRSETRLGVAIAFAEQYGDYNK